MYIMDCNADPQTLVWNTMPYGYTRAPFIARSLMKPLIGKWRKLGMKVVVFYDDGMAVDLEKLNNDAGIMHSDLVNAGLIPGVGKCIWTPVSKVDWNGLHFNFDTGGISILQHRVDKTLANIEAIISDWPNVTFRQVARLVGQIISMNPVFNGTEQLRSRMLQTFINIRHYKNKFWEALIQADYEPLFQLALAEMKKLKFMMENNNFRLFREYIIVPEKAVSYNTALKYFKNMLKDAGLDFKMFGLHSPRIGATADAFKAKVPEHVIDRRGRWKSANSKFGYLQKNESYFLECIKK